MKNMEKYRGYPYKCRELMLVCALRLFHRLCFYPIILVRLLVFFVFVLFHNLLICLCEFQHTLRRVLRVDMLSLPLLADANLVRVELLADIDQFVVGKDALIDFLTEEEKINKANLKRKGGKKNRVVKKKCVEEPNDGGGAEAKTSVGQDDDDDFEEPGGLLKMLKKVKK